jgi:hypothetical protein
VFQLGQHTATKELKDLKELIDESALKLVSEFACVSVWVPPEEMASDALEYP